MSAQPISLRDMQAYAQMYNVLHDLEIMVDYIQHMDEILMEHVRRKDGNRSTHKTAN